MAGVAVSVLYPQDVYEPELLAAIEHRLAERPVLLVGPVGSGSREVALTFAQQTNTNVILDLNVAMDYVVLVGDVLRQIVSALATPLEISQLREDTKTAALARLRVANAFGSSTEEVIAICQGRTARGWQLERALKVLPAHSRVIAADVHRLMPESALWELRQLANDAQLQLLLSTRPSHYAQFTGPDSALYGNVWTVELSSPSLSRWAEVLGERELNLDDLEWLLEKTRGRVSTTLNVLEYQEKRAKIHHAWRQAVQASFVRADDVLRLTDAIHPFAPKLLRAIAQNDPPYGAIEGASSQRVARVLAHLRKLDLIEQPQPRRWEIADPLLSAAIADST